MIARIRGTVIEILEKGVVLDTGALGYAVFTPAAIGLGEVVELHTHLVIREDAHELYGFHTREEKQLFLLLLSVSGVGPKTALHMLTMYPLRDLVHAIKTGDAKTISLVPGVGKKTAEKISIDLKDKLAAFTGSEGSAAGSDLVEALLSLGFKEYDIRAILPTIDADIPLEKQITTALQLLKK